MKPALKSPPNFPLFLMASDSPSPGSPVALQAPDEANLLPPDDFWDQHKSKILAGVAVLVTLALAAILILQWLERQKQNAMADYAQADSIEAWQEIIRKYPGQPVAGNAALLLAAAQRQAGDTSAAEATYLQLQEAKLTYPLQALSSLGLAELMAAEKSLTPAQAAAAFQQAAATFPNSFVAPYARYTEASIYLAEGQDEAAAAGFRAVASDYPTSILARLSSMQLQRLAPSMPVPAAAPASGEQPVAAPEGQAAPIQVMPAEMPAPSAEAPAPDAAP